jgi:hypothetical protein
VPCAGVSAQCGVRAEQAYHVSLPHGSDTGEVDEKIQNILARVEQRPWKRVLLFCDNAGADVMGMLLLARALVRVGGDDCVAVLVANSTPGTHARPTPRVVESTRRRRQRQTAKRS